MNPFISFPKIITYDVGALVPFYEQALGFRLQTTINFDQGDPHWHMDEVVLTNADQQGPALVLLAYRHRPRPAAGGLMLGLRVGNCLEIADRVIAAGGSLERELREAPELGVRNVLVTDPHGNILELLERVEPSERLV